MLHPRRRRLTADPELLLAQAQQLVGDLVGGAPDDDAFPRWRRASSEAGNEWSPLGGTLPYTPDRCRSELPPDLEASAPILAA